MNTLSVTQIQVEGFDKNFSYLIVDEENKKCALVDPCGDIDRVLNEIKKRDLELVAILITHSHFDHHEKLGDVLDRFSVPVYIHKNGIERINAPKEIVRSIVLDTVINLGDSLVRTYYTPGHNDDSVCFYIEKDQAVDNIPKLVTGDTLFVEGCGRTTEAGVEDLYKSLQFLATLPDETEVFTGHDYGNTPSSTIGREKQNNKYYLAKDFEEFRAIRLPNS